MKFDYAIKLLDKEMQSVRNIRFRLTLAQEWVSSEYDFKIKELKQAIKILESEDK